MRAVPFTSGSDFPFNRLLKGALAGLLATAAMSVSMVLGWLILPRREQYPLPPRLIIEEITERAGVEGQLREGELVGLTIFSHFGYGAVFGAIFALFERQVPWHAMLQGALAGVAIWVGSYLGWLPAMHILTPATQHPWRRNLLMIVSHVIWGVTLGNGLRKLIERE